MRILILGAGFGGLELSTRLSEEFGESVDVVLVDRSDGFVFGFSKLDVMFGRVSAPHVVHSFADVVKPGVTFVQAEVTAIDPVTRVVGTSTGELSGDVVVVALGADVHPELTPGLLDGGHEFYTPAGAFALAEVLREFDGGRVVVGVTSTPFKCPPAPSEATLMVHELLERRGLLDRSSVELVLPLPVPIPPSPQASTTILQTFAERRIAFRGGTLVSSLDADRRIAHLSDGDELEYDLFLGVPVHLAPTVVVEAGMTVEGWVPVDSLTLETRYPGVYAVGDVTSVGTPKAGVFAEGQAAVVAAAISARVRGTNDSPPYDGHGICYMEFGHDQIAMVDVFFQKGVTPHGDLIGPSTELMTRKSDFGTSRIRRWFGREWYALNESGTPES